METFPAIFSRRSVRRYSDRPVSPETLRAILCAGMAGPSCVNARDWCFVVAQTKQTLAAMADANGDPARPLRSRGSRHPGLRRSRSVLSAGTGLLGH